MSVTPLIAGNWKMNGLGRDLETISAIAAGAPAARVHTMICPPFPLLREAVGASANTTLAIGAQDCHVGEAGAHTGDVSAAMIKDAGAGAVIVGHSERRSDHGETDAVVKAKAAAALGQDLTAIICVGETAGQRQSKQAEAVVLRQLDRSLPAGATSDNIVIAYEPVWAIGTGLTATPDDVAAMHGAIREALVQRFGAGGSDVALLYGGSVKPGNAAELLRVANVNGALVGGASLKAEDFLAIANAAC